MQSIKQFRTVNASLWQSAVNQVIAQKKAASSPAAGLAATGVADMVKFCSVTAFRIAEASVKAYFTHDHTELNLLRAQFDTPFAHCDLHWG
jgi:hypothetical protein